MDPRWTWGRVGILISLATLLLLPWEWRNLHQAQERLLTHKSNLRRQKNILNYYKRYTMPKSLTVPSAITPSPRAWPAKWLKCLGSLNQQPRTRTIGWGTILLFWMITMIIWFHSFFPLYRLFTLTPTTGPKNGHGPDMVANWPLHLSTSYDQWSCLPIMSPLRKQ